MAITDSGHRMTSQQCQPTATITYRPTVNLPPGHNGPASIAVDRTISSQHVTKPVQAPFTLVQLPNALGLRALPIASTSRCYFRITVHSPRLACDPSIHPRAPCQISLASRWAPLWRDKRRDHTMERLRFCHQTK